jgi:predicted acyl esterase
MEHRHVWITMQDGTRLAARLFLPVELPAPVILEALPYRMDDLTSSTQQTSDCAKGGAVCRLDIRNGESGGIGSTSTTRRSTRTSAR